MHNHVAPGHRISIVAPRALAAGDGVRVGALFGIATGAAAEGEEIDLALTGVFALPKPAGETWSAGDRVFWDDAARAATTTVASNTRIGTAIAGAAAEGTEGMVRLNGDHAGGVHGPPPGLGWTEAPFVATRNGNRYALDLSPRDLVDQAIWTGPAFHVDGAGGDDANSGLGSTDGDFSDAKRTIHAAFTAGNATGAAFRVLMRSGLYAESSFTSNGNVEPSQSVAVIGWDGPVQYRTGPWEVNWTLDHGTTWSAPVSSVRRAFRTDILTAEGLYTELELAADLATCRVTPGSWFTDGTTTHVNIGAEPGAADIALIRSFHGARFLTHAQDLYLENIHCEGGITGALHCDPAAARNIVAVNSSFRYSAPSTPSAPLDAVRVRRTEGLVAFFDCDASCGAKDGWNFHGDGVTGMNVLLANCNGWRNGSTASGSDNAVTAHDDVVLAAVGGRFGLSVHGTEAHFIETTRSWFLGTTVTSRDIDGSATAFKCSQDAQMWLQDTIADAAGAAENLAIEANGGIVRKRDHLSLAGAEVATGTGQILDF